MKILKSITQILCNLWKWIITPQGISTGVLIITLYILILTFLYAYRPYVGVVGRPSSYNKATKDLVANIAITNTGNVPANNTQTYVRLYVNSELKANVQGISKFLLFPGQVNYSPEVFHNVEVSNLDNDIFEIQVEVRYEMRITHWWARKFVTTTGLRYDKENSTWRSISGEAT